MLATGFSQRTEHLGSAPLDNDTIRSVAPSIFAEGAHDSRSARYAYLPTAAVLDGLRREGFQPFFVAQSKATDESRRPYTKHMLRLRHASQISARDEQQEIILINSHDGSSSYQMLAGCFRFACANGLVCGDTVADIRIPHVGDVAGRVIEGAYRVLDNFERVAGSMDAMKAITLDEGEQLAFGRAALELRYDEGRAPLTPAQVLEPRRHEDRGNDLWHVFNRTQENVIRGGQRGKRRDGKRMTTRRLTAIDSNVKLNRALWVLADELRKLKG